MPKNDLDTIPLKIGSVYPAVYADQVVGRHSLRLGPTSGLTQFGVNIVALEPGAKSSLRHWHVEQDEFVMMVSGELVMVDNSGETLVTTGDCCAFPANDQNGHHFVNRSNVEARFLVIGTDTPTETVYYSDIDMMGEIDANGANFTRNDGSEIEDKE